MDGPNALLPEFWQTFLKSSLAALGEQCRPICVGMTRRSLIAAGTMRQWRQRLEEINREGRKLGIGVLGEWIFQRYTLGCSMRWTTCSYFADCCDAFDIIQRTAVLGCAMRLTTGSSLPTVSTRSI